jgi:hypothetical protein
MLDAHGDAVTGLERGCPGFVDRSQGLINRSSRHGFIAVVTDR